MAANEESIQQQQHQQQGQSSSSTSAQEQQRRQISAADLANALSFASMGQSASMLKMIFLLQI